MIKAVVFDLDDTLISEREYVKSGFKKVAEKISIDFKIDNDKVYEVLDTEFRKDTKLVFNRSLEELNIKYNRDYILDLINIYRNHKPMIELYEDAKYIIKALSEEGMKLGIITDGHKITQRNKLEALNIYKYFNEVIVTDELGREYWKPHKKPYELMKQKLGLDYKEMIYVGDNISKDFVTANKLGIHTIMITREYGIYKGLKYDKKYEAKLKISKLNKISSAINTFGEEIDEKDIVCNNS